MDLRKIVVVFGLIVAGCHRELKARCSESSPCAPADANESGDVVLDVSGDSETPMEDSAASDADSTAPDAGCSKVVCQIRELAAGQWHSCALFKSGKVKCWGDTGYGQIGLPASTTASSKTPVEVPFVEGAVRIVAGTFHTCARIAEGTVMCWGDNEWGKLGDGTIAARDGAALVKNLTDATALFASQAHTCVITKSGAVKCWGAAADGESGPMEETAPLPQTVEGVTAPAQLALGRRFSCARMADGNVMCWGNGTSTPSAMTSLSAVTQLSAKADHACAVTAGTVKCWGSNMWGALGDGTREDRSTPTTVPGLAGITEVVVGEMFTCARDAKSAWCWGGNMYGAIGDGTNTDRLTPTPVTGLKEANHLALGASHAMALASEKHLVWGWNYAGQLGITTVTNWATLPTELGW